MTDRALTQKHRALWKAHGGSWHGPRVETWTMPEANIEAFLRDLLAAAQLSAALQVPEVAALVEAATRLLREAELDGMETRAGWDCWMSLCRKSLAAMKGPQT